MAEKINEPTQSIATEVATTLMSKGFSLSDSQMIPTALGGYISAETDRVTDVWGSDFIRSRNNSRTIDIVGICTIAFGEKKEVYVAHAESDGNELEVGLPKFMWAADFINHMQKGGDVLDIFNKLPRTELAYTPSAPTVKKAVVN